MNWGHKITLAYIGFIGFILYMVVRAFAQDVDLVTKDYYAQEITYQNKLERKANALNAPEKATVKLIGKEIVVTIPNGGGATGEIHFYHPSKELFDRKYPVELDNQNIQKIERSEIVAGNYRVNLNWEVAGKQYFQQEKVYIR